MTNQDEHCGTSPAAVRHANYWVIQLLSAPGTAVLVLLYHLAVQSCELPERWLQSALLQTIHYQELALRSIAALQQHRQRSSCTLVSWFTCSCSGEYTSDGRVLKKTLTADCGIFAVAAALTITNSKTAEALVGPFQIATWLSIVTG
jgi:hypothetical protein